MTFKATNNIKEITTRVNPFNKFIFVYYKNNKIPTFYIITDHVILKDKFGNLFDKTRCDEEILITPAQVCAHLLGI